MSKNNLEQKSMLFGTTPMDKEKKKSIPITSKSSTSTATPKKPHTHLSPAACEKKIAEGKELHDRALKHLKTSLFQWSPDHLAAAATLEAAANCYNAAGELEQAQTLYLQSADSHDKAGSAAACAQTLLKASKVAKTRGDWRATADIHQRSAVMWGVTGDASRAGEFLLKAAKELEKGDPPQAQELYLKGLDHLCPEDTPEESMSSCPAIVPEAFRQCFEFYMSVRSSSPTAVAGDFNIPTLEIVSFCNRMIRVFSGLEAEASKCRMILTVTLLQLELGDVVAADRGFMDKLSDSDYLKSNESALAEDIITAYKDLDCDKLESVQRSHHLMHLDRSVQVLARGLSLLRGHSTGADTVTGTGGGNVVTPSSASKQAPTQSQSVPKQEQEPKQDQRQEQRQEEDVSSSLNALVIEKEELEQQKQEEEDQEEGQEVIVQNDDDDDDDDDDFDLT